MRIMRSIALGSLLLLAPTAHADKRAHKKSQPATGKVAVVDDEPTSQNATHAPTDPAADIKLSALPTRGTDDPQPKAIKPATPAPTAVGVKTALPDAVTHQPTAPPPASQGAPATFSDDAVLELAAKQMRHNRHPLDACATDAQHRHPAATGSVTLRFTIEDRHVVNLVVDKDQLHDSALTSCLLAAGKSLNFSLKQASFYWPVTLSPTASN
jgi:hypothetical protein